MGGGQGNEESCGSQGGLTEKKESQAAWSRVLELSMETFVCRLICVSSVSPASRYSLRKRTRHTRKQH